MKVKMLRYLSILALACPTVAWSACSGEACDDVNFSFENGCYVARNTGTRKIKVERGPYGVQLGPGATDVLRINGNCPQNYMGGEKAVYLDSPKSEGSRQPVRATSNSEPPRPEPLPRANSAPTTRSDCNGRECLVGVRR